LRAVQSALTERGDLVELVSAEEPTSFGRRDRLVDELTPELNEISQDLDPALWGGAPRPTEVLSAELANLRKEFSARKELEGRSLARAEVAELLGTSDQSVTDALESRRLLRFRRGRRWLIPAWQLDAEAERGVLPGLVRCSRRSRAVWLR